MTLLWTLAALLLAYCVARYNKSNKLFWQLVLAFTVGFSVIVICSRTFGNTKEGNANLTQVCPTQGDVVTLDPMVYLSANVTIPAPKVTASNLVGQVYTPVISKTSIIPSKVFGRTRDQPLSILVQPPENLGKIPIVLYGYG